MSPDPAFRFSRRTDWPEDVNALFRSVQKKKSDGSGLLDLTVSNPTVCGFSSADPRILAPFSDPANLIYDPDPRGIAAAREAVAAYYARHGVRVDPSDIFLTPGTSEAYAWLFRLIGEAGDVAAVPMPGYPLFDDLLRLADMEIARYALRYDRHWSLDVESLNRITAARIVIAVNPNNPAGHYVLAQEREALNRFAAERGACLISDEVFLDYPLDGLPRGALSLASNPHVLTFTLGGVSKAAAMPQMKLAWIVVSGPVAARTEACRRLEHVADTYLSVATPPQRALPVWLGLSHDMRSEIMARVRENRQILERGAAEAGAVLLDAEGGWSAVLRISADDEGAALALLQQDGVLVHPGYLFDFEGNHLVLSLLTEPRIFAEAARRIWHRLKTS